MKTFDLKNEKDIVYLNVDWYGCDKFAILFKDKTYTEKDVEVLEILKKKKVDIYFLFRCSNFKDYNCVYIELGMSNLCLTKEEFKLLKEWLKK